MCVAPTKQQDASWHKLLKLECWKCHIQGKRTWDETTKIPLFPFHPSHKKHKSHSTLQLYISLQGVLQLSASYSNPQLLPARNFTVRNLSARRLKPEECYCSGHSCTSAGLATAATVRACVRGCGGRRKVEEGRREESKVWKRQLYAFPVLCGLMTKPDIVDSKLTHSTGLGGCKALPTSPLCLRLSSSTITGPTLCLSLFILIR